MPETDNPSETTVETTRDQMIGMLRLQRPDYFPKPNDVEGLKNSIEPSVLNRLGLKEHTRQFDLSQNTERAPEELWQASFSFYRKPYISGRTAGMKNTSNGGTKTDYLTGENICFWGNGATEYEARLNVLHQMLEYAETRDRNNKEAALSDSGK